MLYTLMRQAYIIFRFPGILNGFWLLLTKPALIIFNFSKYHRYFRISTACSFHMPEKIEQKDWAILSSMLCQKHDYIAK